jgi:hypothetical protein
MLTAAKANYAMSNKRMHAEPAKRVSYGKLGVRRGPGDAGRWAAAPRNLVILQVCSCDPLLTLQRNGSSVSASE